MKRRRLLAATGTALAASTAGCVVGGHPVAGETSLGPPERERDGGDSYLQFRRDGERVATIGLLARDWGSEPGRVRFRTHVWHIDDLQIDRLRYLFRVPTGPNGPFPDIYFKRPDGGPWPEFTFQRRDDLGETVFEMRDIGLVGRGSITLDFFAETSGDTLPLTVDALAELVGGGIGRFTAEGSLEREFDVESA